MQRYCLIGPTHPFRGVIAHYMTLLARHLAIESEVIFRSFTRQYPGRPSPGRSDRDPSHEPITTNAEYLLDPINPLSWRRVLKLLSEYRAEVVVIPWWVPSWAPAWSTIRRQIKRLLESPKLQYICHNIYPHESKPWDRAAAKIALLAGDGFIVHASSDEQKLLDLIPGVRIRVTPLPSHSELVPVGKAPMPVQLPDDRPLLLFCGFVRSYKGLDILLNALPTVLEKRKVNLLVAGEFCEGGLDYRSEINELGLADAVTIVDQYLPNELLATYVERAAVVVLPYPKATQSGIVQRAFGKNTPVITTDVGGLAESVEHGRTGMVVASEDANALAEVIIYFFDLDLGPGFEQNIRIDSERFGWKRLVVQLEELAGPEAGV